MAHRGRQSADELLAVALASGQTVRAAAVATGIGEKTAHRRWADLAFQRHVSELRGEMVGRACGQLADGMTAASTKLRQLLDATDERVALSAARSILELGIKLRDAVELETRIAALERNANTPLQGTSR